MPGKFKAILIGDAHFGAPTHMSTDSERKREFIDFLKKFAGKTEMLVITGDLFDFWFEYPGVVPVNYLDILNALEEATKKTKIVYLPGNHDLWVGTTIENLGEGIKITDSIVFKIKDIKIKVTHGHQLSRSISSRILNSVLSNPVAIFMFRLLHPSLGYSIGRVVSRISRLRNSSAGKIPGDLKDIAMSLSEDVLIVGHFHIPGVLKTGQKSIVIAGDWLLSRNYTVVTERGIDIYNFLTNQVVRSLSFDGMDER